MFQDLSRRSQQKSSSFNLPVLFLPHPICAQALVLIAPAVDITDLWWSNLSEEARHQALASRIVPLPHDDPVSGLPFPLIPCFPHLDFISCFLYLDSAGCYRCCAPRCFESQMPFLQIYFRANFCCCAHEEHVNHFHQQIQILSSVTLPGHSRHGYRPLCPLWP